MSAVDLRSLNAFKAFCPAGTLMLSSGNYDVNGKEDHSKPPQHKRAKVLNCYGYSAAEEIWTPTGTHDKMDVH